MSELNRDLIFLIMQFLNEEKYKETLHELERDSGYFFSVNYFKELILNGNWDEAERYLSGFTKLNDNDQSRKIFFEMRKQKYLEALDRHDRSMATTILVNELKPFAMFSEELFKELTQLLTLNNFREHERLTSYINAENTRILLMIELNKLFKANPLFCNKLIFPDVADSGLRSIINQSLNWQHVLCTNPSPDPEMETLFMDDRCSEPRYLNARPTTRPSTSNQGNGSTSQIERFFPEAPNMPLLPIPGPIQTPFSLLMHNVPTVPHPASSGGTIGAPSNSARTLAPLKSSTDSGDDTNTRPSGISNRMMLPTPGENGSPVFDITNEFPTTVVETLNQGSCPTSMDFHPAGNTLLLVGTNVGDIGLWEVHGSQKLVSKSFQLWDFSSISTQLKLALDREPCAAVRRMKWSPDGSFFGAAYSKHIMHLYTYLGENCVQQHLEIESHTGSVNDLAFASPNKQLSVITCGDDKAIKVWDVTTGAKLFTFEGHEAPVYSVCPHVRGDIHIIFSTSMDGKIKAWLYDTTQPGVEFDAPGRGCTTMACTGDGKRLFSCGTNQNGETNIVEWIEIEGHAYRLYQGFEKCSLGTVQFDIAKSRFLAAGDGHSIKIWEMDKATPCIRFNKDGTLLALSTRDNKVKILAVVDSLQTFRSYDAPYVSAMGTASGTMTKSGDTDKNLECASPRKKEIKPKRTLKLTELTRPAEFRSLVLPAPVKMPKGLLLERPIF